jgi:hypothetical protein
LPFSIWEQFVPVCKRLSTPKSASISSICVICVLFSFYFPTKLLIFRQLTIFSDGYFHKISFGIDFHFRSSTSNEIPLSAVNEP